MTQASNIPPNQSTPPLTVDELSEKVARRVVELLTHAPAVHANGGPRTAIQMNSSLVDAKTVASELGVSRTFVYEHAAELGAVRLGNGSKRRLRFDLETVIACSSSRRSEVENADNDGQSGTAPRRRRRRLPNGLPQAGSVLAIKPRRVA